MLRRIIRFFQCKEVWLTIYQNGIPIANYSSKYMSEMNERRLSQDKYEIGDGVEVKFYLM